MPTQPMGEDDASIEDTRSRIEKCKDKERQQVDCRSMQNREFDRMHRFHRLVFDLVGGKSSWWIVDRCKTGFLT